MIRYMQGDATLPPTRPALIAHVVNDIGVWGAGFSGALGARWPLAEKSYREWARGRVTGNDGRKLTLGTIVVVEVAPSLAVAHLCAQRGLRGRRNPRPLDDAALDRTLWWLSAYCSDARTPLHLRTLHMPRIGCNLAGGQWIDVEPLVAKHLGHLDVTVYDLPARPA